MSKRIHCIVYLQDKSVSRRQRSGSGSLFLSIQKYISRKVAFKPLQKNLHKSGQYVLTLEGDGFILAFFVHFIEEEVSLRLARPFGLGIKRPAVSLYCCTNMAVSSECSRSLARATKFKTDWCIIANIVRHAGFGRFSIWRGWGRRGKLWY